MLKSKNFICFQLSRPSSTQPTKVLSSSPSTAPPSRLPSFSPSPSSQLPNFPSTHVPQHPPRLSSPTPNPPHHVNGSLPASKTVPPSHLPSFPPTSQTSSTTSRLPASAHNTLGLPSPAPQVKHNCKPIYHTNKQGDIKCEASSLAHSCTIFLCSLDVRNMMINAEVPV